jgi:NRPS condensation-like uncharacterized protein
MTTRVTDCPAAARRARPFSVGDGLNCYFDFPSEPNNVHLEAWLPGHLSPGRLRAAVADVLADVPQARVRRTGAAWWQARYAWEVPAEPDIDPVSVLCWRTGAELDAARVRFLSAAPALGRSPVFRLLLAQGQEWDSVILNAHHAAFDGRSCVSLLRLIADRYDAPRPGEAPGGGVDRPRSVPAERPRLPGVLPGTEPRAGGPRAGSVPARKARPATGWRTARIAAQHTAGHVARGPGYGFSLLDWPGTPESSRPAGEPRVTVNDLLIAALAETVTRWNAARRRRQRQRRIRISMPIDTRPPGRGSALGNLSRLSTVDVDPSRAADLTAAVAGQTCRAKNSPGPPVGPVLAAVVTAPAPAGVKRGLTRLALRTLGGIRCDTTLLSNLGNITDPPAFGLLVPARLWFSTSTHMPRGLSVGAVSVGGQLQLCFRYRTALLDEAAGHAFAAEYAQALSRLSRPADREAGQ